MNADDADWIELKRVGGWLCLDFINTVDRTENGLSGEWLHQYADWINWSQHAQILTTQQAKLLLSHARQNPDRAEAVFRQALALRERLYRLFSAIAAQQSPNSQDVAQLNQDIAEMHRHTQLVYTEGAFSWSWIDCDQLAYPLWLIIQSATDLLIDERLNRVRECAGSDCGWIFLDTSRNRSRRWCDMEDCGNRAKAQRHYRRNQASQKTSSSK